MCFGNNYMEKTFLSILNLGIMKQTTDLYIQSALSRRETNNLVQGLGARIKTKQNPNPNQTNKTLNSKTNKMKVNGTHIW